jgi:acetoin utilization protein AcuB
MFVDNSMTRKVIAVHPDVVILEARETMTENGIRHLPVVDSEDRLAGIVTDRDIRSAMPSVLLDDADSQEIRKRLARVTVKEIMTRDPVTIPPQYTIQDALLLIQKTRVGAFPVVDETGRLKGIISIRDLVRAFINVLGIGEPGMLIGILVEERIGQLKQIVDAITEEKISFGSVLVARHWEEGKRAVFPYLLTNNAMRAKKKLQEMGYTLIDPMEWYLDQIPKHD